MAFLSLQQHMKHPEYEELIQVLKERHKNERVERSSIVTVNVGVSLPEELIIESLSWLPVKTLLQFKIVCKSWYSIIVSHSFISKHLVNYYDNNHDMDCFLTSRAVRHNGDDFHARFVDKTLEVYATAKLDKPPVQYFKICGPCNGIYYFCRDYGGGCLWNPTINDLKVLPPLIMKPGLPKHVVYDLHETYGLGYDPVTEDYKVVLIKEHRIRTYPWIYVYEDGFKLCPAVLVYSLKTDSWKYWGDLPHFYDRLNNNETHIFVNGCLYWIGIREDNNFKAIISFNILTNVLQEIQMPEYEKESSTSLGIYKDSVAFYTTHGPHYEGDRFFDIWTCDEKCWTKKFSIGPFGERVLYPIGHLKNDVAIILYGGDLVLCNPDKEERWEIAIKSERFDSVVVYKESLVSISGLSTNPTRHDTRRLG